MGDVVNWRGAKDMHPSSFIQDEMTARNWTRYRMAIAMAASSAGDPSISLLCLDLYLEVGDDYANLRLGDMADEIAGAFGISRDFFINLENAWLAAQPAPPPKPQETP